MNAAENQDAPCYNVVVIGGALSGAATAVKTVRARWIVDASGVAALLARKEGWWRQNAEHPTAAAWSRWKGSAMLFRLAKMLKIREQSQRPPPD